MHAGITAITELAVKSGLTNRLPWATRPEFEIALITFMVDDRPGQLR
jgi:hypothetical protein